jgi:hypothetical protein
MHVLLHSTINHTMHSLAFDGNHLHCSRKAMPCSTASSSRSVLHTVSGMTSQLGFTAFVVCAVMNQWQQRRFIITGGCQEVRETSRAP